MIPIFTPAFGCDYETAAQAVQAFLEDKDFEIQAPGIRGGYANQSDLKTYRDQFQIDRISIRYKRKTCIVFMNRKEDGTWVAE